MHVLCLGRYHARGQGLYLCVRVSLRRCLSCAAFLACGRRETCPLHYAKSLLALSLRLRAAAPAALALPPPCPPLDDAVAVCLCDMQRGERGCLVVWMPPPLDTPADETVVFGRQKASAARRYHPPHTHKDTQTLLTSAITCLHMSCPCSLCGLWPGVAFTSASCRRGGSPLESCGGLPSLGRV